MSESIPPDITANAPANGSRWYVVHANSGMEQAVERNTR